ncbi:OmpA family protein [Shewanella corallii]|uniref:OmpA family protein n=1 Tax=Shewanella corallii TaxID=560080 RepID=A0ABT0N6J8_9GAMM|nr:OmpA family protein [Shewanella corallii]MCL2914029.1 OmpA family protein [Shewanella corallii]
MRTTICGLTLLLCLSGCTTWPEYAGGGMAELFPADLYPVESNGDMGPEQGLRMEWELTDRKLNILILQGAELCFPATVVQAELNQRRIVRQLQGGLLYDAATDIIAQRQLLHRLDKRLKDATRYGKCVLPEKDLEGLIDSGNVTHELSRLLNQDNQFAVNSFQLNPKFIGHLAAAAARLKLMPQYSLLITGHADDQGSLDYNFQLANARAEQVKRYLMIFGLDESQIHLDSVGETDPLLKGTHPEIRLTNRRVTIAVIETKLAPATGKGSTAKGEAQ